LHAIVLILNRFNLFYQTINTILIELIPIYLIKICYFFIQLIDYLLFSIILLYCFLNSPFTSTYYFF